MSTCEYCDTPVGFGATRCNSETCYLGEIGRLRQKLAASERERQLYRKGYEARGKILAAYRTGGRPSAKALDDAAEVASLLDKDGG